MVEVTAVYEFDNLLDTFTDYLYQPYIRGEDHSKTRLNKRGTFYARRIDKEAGLKELIFRVSGITKDHFKYGEFLEEYDPENPFSEPVSIPSNIQGGLGMFILKNSVVFK